MTTPEHFGEEKQSGTDEQMKESLLGDLSEIRDPADYVRDEDGSAAETGADVVMQKIGGLEILKEGGYEVDLEKTIHDMFGVTKNMESQLERVLRINAQLENDLTDSKKMLAELKAAKSKLEQKVSLLETEVPSKRELQIEIDHLTEERNLAQVSIRDQKTKISKIQKTLLDYQKQVASLAEERKDALAEINFLESRLNKATQKIRESEVRINALSGEKLALTEKIQGLEKDLTETLDEKYKLIKELKGTTEAMTELRSTLADRKLQAKKSFYKAGEGKKRGSHSEK